MKKLKKKATCLEDKNSPEIKPTIVEFVFTDFQSVKRINNNKNVIVKGWNTTTCSVTHKKKQEPHETGNISIFEEIFNKTRNVELG